MAVKEQGPGSIERTETNSFISSSWCGIIHIIWTEVGHVASEMGRAAHSLKFLGFLKEGDA